MTIFLIVIALIGSGPSASAKATADKQDLRTSGPQDLKAGPRVIRVSAERFAFFPSEITVDKGTTIEFHLTSEDTDHGFRIIDTDIDVQIPKRRRGEAVVKYTADTAGRFVIECSRPCGAGHTAMRATLVVK